MDISIAPLSARAEDEDRAIHRISASRRLQISRHYRIGTWQSQGDSHSQRGSIGQVVTAGQQLAGDWSSRPAVAKFCW